MDFKRLAENLGLEVEEYKGLVELFIETSMADFESLSSAVKNDNTAEVIQHAHAISGAGGNLGLSEIYEVGRRIEERANSEALDDIEADLREFKTLIDAVVSFVES